MTIQQNSPDRVGMDWLRLNRIVFGHSKREKRRARSGLDSTNTVASRSGSCTTAAPARHSTTDDSTVILRQNGRCLSQDPFLWLFLLQLIQRCPMITMSARTWFRLNRPLTIPLLHLFSLRQSLLALILPVLGLLLQQSKRDIGLSKVLCTNLLVRHW